MWTQMPSDKEKHDDRSRNGEEDGRLIEEQRALLATKTTLLDALEIVSQQMEANMKRILKRSRAVCQKFEEDAELEKTLKRYKDMQIDQKPRIHWSTTSTGHYERSNPSLHRQDFPKSISGPQIPDDTEHTDEGARLVRHYASMVTKTLLEEEKFIARVNKIKKAERMVCGSAEQLQKAFKTKTTLIDFQTLFKLKSDRFYSLAGFAGRMERVLRDYVQGNRRGERYSEDESDCSPLHTHRPLNVSPTWRNASLKSSRHSDSYWSCQDKLHDSMECMKADQTQEQSLLDDLEAIEKSKSVVDPLNALVEKSKTMYSLSCVYAEMERNLKQFVALNRADDLSKRFPQIKQEGVRDNARLFEKRMLEMLIDEE